MSLTHSQIAVCQGPSDSGCVAAAAPGGGVCLAGKHEGTMPILPADATVRTGTPEKTIDASDF